jgi:hypothetical protein
MEIDDGPLDISGVADASRGDTESPTVAVKSSAEEKPLATGIERDEFTEVR